MNHQVESFQSRGFRLACAIVHLYTKLAVFPSCPIHIARQVLRAGTSIGANLEEAKGAHSRRDAAAKFSIALKEARETSYWLRLIRETRLAPRTLLDPLIEDASALIGVLTVARRRLSIEG